MDLSLVYHLPTSKELAIPLELLRASFTHMFFLHLDNKQYGGYVSRFILGFSHFTKLNFKSGTDISLLDGPYDDCFRSIAMAFPGLKYCKCF